MKYKPPHSAAIFYDDFYRSGEGGGAWPHSPHPGYATVYTGVVIDNYHSMAKVFVLLFTEGGQA